MEETKNKQASDYKLRFLEPEEMEFFKVGDALRVIIKDDKCCLRVVPMRAFPVSMRNQYISLRDMEGNELGMIKDPTKLDKQTRKLLDDEINKRYFTPVITSIKSLNDKFGVVEWEVDTNRGKRKFFTRSLHESIKEIEDGFLVTDLENNRYEIHQQANLDQRSMAILSRNV